MPSGITGNFAQVQAALAAVAIRVEAAGEPVERASAEIVADIAEELAPRFTGQLARDVDTDGGIVVVNNRAGVPQEYGTRRHAAQPFLRPAKDRSEPIVKRTAEAIYTAVTR